MASRCRTFSSFHPVNLPSCGPNSSFSIRRLLDLPEESEEERSPSSVKSSPTENCSRALPLVPRVVRPILHNRSDSGPGTGLMNWQDFGLMPYTHHWACGRFPFRDQRFPLGKSIERISKRLLFVHIRQKQSDENYKQFSFTFPFCVLIAKIN